jgi:hypothetical protein
MRTSNLPHEKVADAIQKLPLRLRRIAARQFRRRTRRHGSDEFGKDHPNVAIKPEDRRVMDEMKRSGMSFRAIEDAWRLFPNSGNDAQRCIRLARKALRKAKAKAAAK